MNRARGTDVSTLLVFLRCVRSYVNLIDGADNIIAVWDSRLCRGQPNFRSQETDTDYKGNRDREILAGAHDDDDQIQKCIEAIGGFNMFPNRMEADDVIAWLAHTLTDHELTIVTVDQDMYQLINEKTSVYSPIKKITINNDNFEQTVGVSKDKFLSYKALMGDKSDNIPGVPKVGKKTALKIVNTDITEELHKRGDEAIQRYEKNIELMDLSYGYTVHDGEITAYEQQLEQIHRLSPDKSQLKSLCIHNAVYAIANDIDNWFSMFESRKTNVPNVVNLINSLNISK